MPIVPLMMVELGKRRLGKQNAGQIANRDHVIQHRDGGIDLHADFFYLDHASDARPESVRFSQVSSMGQQFPAAFRSFDASFPRIRKGIANSCPIIKVTYSK